MRSQRTLWAIVISLIVALLGIAFWQFRTQKQLSNLDRTVEQLRFLASAAFDRRERSEIGLQVGTIQFLRTGYSIQLESAEYSTDGLTLAGEVGNPTQLSISNLTVNFMAATPYDFDEWTKSKPASLMKVVGSGQTSPISTLPPGKTVTFVATIPNLRQIPGDTTQPTVFVYFSGERYSYLP